MLNKIINILEKKSSKQLVYKFAEGVMLGFGTYWFEQLISKRKESNMLETEDGTKK